MPSHCIKCNQPLIPGESKCVYCGQVISAAPQSGVNIAGQDHSIGGDVTGRDKITNTTTIDGDQIQGDKVQGDKVEGDKILGDKVVQYITPTLSLRATPPRPPDHFTGREADLDKFTRLLTEGKNVAITALHGIGGIGKTSLAQKLAEVIGRGDPGGRPYFPGGVLWWTLGPNPDVITALDVWARHVDPHADLSSLPTAEARAEAVRPLLAQLGKLCVIIDDVWDASSFNVLKSAIPAGNPVLMTTRDADLAKTLRCRVERIEALSDDEAVDLLEKLLGPLGDDSHPERSVGRPSTTLRSAQDAPDAQSKDALSAACDIAHLTGGLPLALELIAGLADSPADLPVWAQRLREKSPLDVLKRGLTREQSIEICFSLSYEHLDAELQGRFAALGVFALAPFDRDAMAAVWQSDEKKSNGFIAKLLARFRNKPSQKSTVSVDDAISVLVRRSLLSKVDGAPEYSQHALLRAYALALLEKENEHSAVAARHADYYRAFAKEQNWRAVEHAFDQVEHGWQWVQANAPEKIIGYVFAVRVFFNTRGRPFEHIAWQNIALTQTRATNDRKNEGAILNNLAYVYDGLGQKDKALDYYEQALGIWRDAEHGDRAGEGTTLNNLGLVYRALGQQDKALDYFEQALVILREVGDRAGEGTTLNNLGLVYNALGQQDKALDYFEQALVILREVGDRAGEGTTLNNLGLVYRALGQQDKALDYFEQALVILREVGDRAGEGGTLNNLGAVYRALGQMDKALDYYEQALIIHREVGNRTLEGTTLNNLGGVYDALGQQDKALDYYAQALVIRREVGDRAGEGVTLNNLGEVYRTLGQKDKALAYYEQALGIRREVGDRFGESVTLFNIGLLLDEMGRTAEAVTYLEQNVALDEAIGHPDLESDRRTLTRVRARLTPRPPLPK